MSATEETTTPTLVRDEEALTATTALVYGESAATNDYYREMLWKNIPCVYPLRVKYEVVMAALASARLAALEEAARSMCPYCAQNTPAERRPVWMHPATASDGLEVWVCCSAASVRRLMEG